MESQFVNPVYPRTFPDPFVLKYRGEYWAYGTGEWHDGRWFGILRSRDLAAWEDVGGAIEPLPGEWPCLWAPEVSYHNGTFYLYYSLGDEATMQIRVATASHPAGPFTDTGRRLSHETFAIDAHVFVDDDGSRHLFYATDYLEHSHIGTGTARVHLADPLTPTGPSFPVTRARYDWQVYDPNRAEKGGVRWHTIEGSFVLKRKGRYYQMFSGGNWHNLSYGVSYALADDIDTTEEWSQVADGEQTLPILRTVPGKVIGPGHNSAVRGPNNHELFCVYHRWAEDGSGRQLALDRMDWSGERIFLIGPTTTPQPVRPPSFWDFFDDEPAVAERPGWRFDGDWQIAGGELIHSGAEPAEATCAYSAAHFVAEVSVRATAAAGGSYGVALGDQARFLLQPDRNLALGQLRHGDGWIAEELPLPADFDPAAYHLLRVERSDSWLRVQLDEAAARWEGRLEHARPLPLALVAEGVGAAFAGFALTEGWEDSFYPGGSPGGWGWDGDPSWRIADGELRGGDGPLLKGPLPPRYELAVSGRLEGAGFGFYPAATPEALGPLVALAPDADGWAVTITSTDEPARFPLPPELAHGVHRQLRATVADGTVELSCEGAILGTIPAPAGVTHVALAPGGSFDLVRLTGLA